MLAVFDGHNDALTREDHADLAGGRGGGHLDLPRMRKGGMRGGIFATVFLRPDFRDDPDTPLALIAEHARYIADRIGPAHVALGSDFDGATVPAELGDVAGLPRLVEALRRASFTEDELEAVCWGNWRRVLDAWWH